MKQTNWYTRMSESWCFLFKKNQGAGHNNPIGLHGRWCKRCPFWWRPTPSHPSQGHQRSLGFMEKGIATPTKHPLGQCTEQNQKLSRNYRPPRCVYVRRMLMMTWVYRVDRCMPSPSRRTRFSVAQKPSPKTLGISSNQKKHRQRLARSHFIDLIDIFRATSERDWSITWRGRPFLFWWGEGYVAIISIQVPSANIGYI